MGADVPSALSRWCLESVNYFQFLSDLIHLLYIIYKSTVCMQVYKSLWLAESC